MSQNVRPARQHQLTDHGLQFIARREGLRLAAYKPVPWDPWTIGYGHTGPDVTPGLTVTKAQAVRLLRQDIAWAERAVRQMVRVSITDRQFDALVSFVFNVGAGAFGASTLLRRVNERRWWAASREFLRWSKDGSGRVLLGLSRRRRGEARMFYKHRPRRSR